MPLPVNGSGNKINRREASEAIDVKLKNMTEIYYSIRNKWDC